MGSTAAHLARAQARGTHDPPAGRREGRPISRRAALQMIGLGTATAAVAGATGLTRQAIHGGVFSTGTGPAYAAWGQASPEGGAMSMVRGAILAANAHNAQPWTFTLSEDRIEVYADMTRTLGAMDPALRELHISLGCALENLALAGPPNGRTVEVALLPEAADPTHIATVLLTRSPPTTSALFEAITARHTDRAAYDTTRAVAAEDLNVLSALVDVPDTELVWFTSEAQKRTFSELTVRATQAIIDDQAQAAADFRWYRSDWDDIQQHKDGITIDPSGQSKLIRAVSKLVPTTRQQNNDGWLSGTRDTQLPTAAAFGALVVTDPTDPAQRLQVGRIWQRMHLTATGLGLAMQPLCQIPERIDRERTPGFSPDITDATSALLSPAAHPLMTFRIGHPTVAALESPRRPAQDVVATHDGRRS